MKQILPNDLDAEKQTLGAMISSSRAATKLFSSGMLQVDDFFLEDHRSIFITLSELYQDGTSINVKSLIYRLKEAGLKKGIITRPYLMELEAAPLAPSAIMSYASIVKQNSQRRNVIKYAENISKKATEIKPIRELFEEMSSETFNILSSEKSKSFYSKEEAFEQTFKEIQANRMDQSSGGICSNLAAIDHFIKKLQNKRMYIVAARPGVGKSILGVQLLLEAAMQSKYPAIFFSLEMARDQVVARLLSKITGIAVDQILVGDVDDGEMAALKNASKRITNNIYIEDNSNLTTGEMYSISRNACLEHEKISMIVVDYIQYIKSSGIESRQQQISDFSRDLSHMAKELDVPVVVLSQLNRSMDQRQDKKPQLSDLRDSGAIEQDAHAVIMMYYPDEDAKHEVGLIVAKNRSGACGEGELKRDGARFTFRDAGVIQTDDNEIF